MRVLIVESQHDLGSVWSDHLTRLGMDVSHVTGQAAAIANVNLHAPDVIILNLMLEDGPALAVADYASYRRPDARVIFVTNTTFFSDGSIFSHVTNACAFVQRNLPPEDLAAIVEHHGRATGKGMA